MIYLRTENLSVTIKDKFFCKDLNLNIRSGEVWGILGPNGCGKTTLLHVLAGLEAPSEGKIFLLEKNIRQLSNKTIATSLGILFQDVAFTFTQTVWEYCSASRYAQRSYFKKEKQDEQKIVMLALETMQLEKKMTCNINQLSGGEKRRLAIASLLCQTPQVYILDEPTNHLDVRYQIKVLKHFRELTKNNDAAIVMSLHDINHAQKFCDHIILLLPNGQSIQGTCQQMLTASHLTMLYQHPITVVNAGEHKFWKASFN